MFVFALLLQTGFGMFPNTPAPPKVVKLPRSTVENPPGLTVLRVPHQAGMLAYTLNKESLRTDPQSHVYFVPVGSGSSKLRATAYPIPSFMGAGGMTYSFTPQPGKCLMLHRVGAVREYGSFSLLDWQTGEATHLHSFCDRPPDVQWARDGSRFVVARTEGEESKTTLKVISRDGEPITTITTPFVVQGYCWVGTKTLICLPSSRDYNQPRLPLYRVDVTTGAFEILAEDAANEYFYVIVESGRPLYPIGNLVSVSPDERFLLYIAAPAEQERKRLESWQKDIRSPFWMLRDLKTGETRPLGAVGSQKYVWTGERTLITMDGQVLSTTWETLPGGTKSPIQKIKCSLQTSSIHLQKQNTPPKESFEVWTREIPWPEGQALPHLPILASKGSGGCAQLFLNQSVIYWAQTDYDLVEVNGTTLEAVTWAKLKNAWPHS